ncbi:MAG: type II secretion system F family protein [Thermoplasmata archaeon]|nr:type II secretion system F family protein [Thermoplasmata archaeon]
MPRSGALVALALFVLVGLAILPWATGIPPAAAHATLPEVGSPITITPVSPVPGGVSHTNVPNISATWTDSAGAIDPGQVVIDVNGINITGVQSVVISSAGFYYDVPTILKLPSGNNTVSVFVADGAGNHAQSSWGFVVNTAPVAGPGALAGFSLEGVVLDIAVGAGLFGAAFGAYILYLKRTRRFTFRKYFATHPVNKEYLVLYVPLILAFLVVLFGLFYVTATPQLPLLSPEYVVIIGMFVGLTPFALDSRREKQRIRAYERAFAQFLFEMADAMRGGIDPAKAVIELSKTQRNILRTPLRIAADGIRVGRPFEAILRDMAAPMKSPLIIRYAGLIADASTVGGETAAVIYRAAKDMDDFVKIEVERVNRLTMPVAVLYIAFGVLLAVLFALLYIAPTLGGLSLTFLGSTPLSGTGASASAGATSIGAATLKQRFFDLMLVISIGTGVIIGAFTEGKPKYGLLHSLALVAGTAVAFWIVFPG